MAALIGWRFVLRSKSDTGPKGGSGGKGPVVMVAPVCGRTMVQSIQVVGNIVSPMKVEISPKIGGRIQFLEAREGDTVTPGQTLLKIDPSDLQDAVLQQQASLGEARSRLAQAQLTSGATDVGVASQIRQQEAAYNSAKADLNQVQQNYAAEVAAAEAQVTSAQELVTSAQASVDKETATLQNAQSRLDRTTSLNAKGFVSGQDLEDAKTAVVVQQGAVKVVAAQLSSAKSQVKVQEQNLAITKRKGKSDISASEARLAQAKAALDVANANRSQSPAYRANVSALKSQVDAMAAQLGQAQARLRDTEVKSTIAGTITARKADPGALARPGNPGLEIQTLDWLYARASLPIEAGSQIHKGDTAQVTIDALPGQTFSGPIVNLNSAADPQSRQFGIDVRLENPTAVIRPGMFATVTIVTGRVDAKVVVPREALNTDSAGNTTVTVIDDKNVAHVQPVKVGAKDDRGYEILEGVHPTDKVVVLTFNLIKDGQTVTIGTDDKTSGAKGAKRGKR